MNEEQVDNKIMNWLTLYTVLIAVGVIIAELICFIFGVNQPKINEKYKYRRDGEFSFATSSFLQFGEDSYQINRGYGEGNFLSEDYLVQTGEFSKDFDRSDFGYPQNTQWYIEAGNKCDLVMQNLGSKKYGFYCK